MGAPLLRFGESTGSQGRCRKFLGLQEYNAAPGDNSLGLLPAWQLYKNSTYNILADHCGPDRLYILSVGLLKATL